MGRPKRPKRRHRLVIAVVVLLLLGTGSYLTVRRLAPSLAPVLTAAGCQAAARHQTVLLDTEQASIAATIAGVAHRQSMPTAAVTIAYATAMQESKLHDLDYGDQDSVGVFQQRPSQGWGPAKALEDPVYATTKFFGALNRVHGYLSMPVYQAAQDVQHSADGDAYIQYEQMATEMTAAFTGQRGHAVYCWYTSPTPKRADLSAAAQGLASTFGEVPVLQTPAGHSRQLLVQVGTGTFGWEVASWLVTHAPGYAIHQVRYAGYQWQSASGSNGWTREAGEPPSGSLTLS